MDLNLAEMTIDEAMQIIGSLDKSLAVMIWR